MNHKFIKKAAKRINAKSIKYAFGLNKVTAVHLCKSYIKRMKLSYPQFNSLTIKF